MKMNGLALFRRTNERRSWNLASYHDPASITWSWVLSFSLLKPGEHRVWPIFSPWPGVGQTRWSLRVPFVGILRWLTQEKMLRSQRSAR